MSTSTRSHAGSTRQPVWNRLVTGVLRSRAHRLAGSLALLTVTGVRSGRSVTFPVGAVRDADDTLLVLVGKARGKTWWRNLIGGARLEVRLAGREYGGFGYVLDGRVDPVHAAGALRAYLRHQPRAGKALGIGRIRAAGPTPAQLAAAAPGAVLIRIHLLPAAAPGSDRTARPARLSRWIAACIAGEAAGIGVAAGVFAGLDAAVGEPRTGLARALVWLALVAAGAVEGSALGGLQWAVLRRQLPTLPARRWVGATVALAAFAWGIGMLPSTLAGPTSTTESAGPQLPGWLGVVLMVVGGLGAGAAIGAVQAWAARGYATGRTGWIVANAVGWALALTWIFTLAGLPDADWPAWAIALDGITAGVLSGATVGLVTGAWLPRLQPLD